MSAANSSPDPQRSAPMGNGSPEEPARTQPAEPSHVTPPVKERSGTDPSPGSRPVSKPPGNEEPELALEPDLPSDGRDEVGDTMIRNLPQRPELSEPPSQPDPSAT